MTWRLVLVVVPLSVLAIGAGGCSLSKKPPRTSPAAPSASAQPVDHYKQLYTDALGKAKAWQRNATLTRVYRLYDGSFNPPDPVRTVYAFGSLADPNHTFEVRFAGSDEKDQKVGKQSF